MPYDGWSPHLGLPAFHDSVREMSRRRAGSTGMTRGRTIGWTLCGLLLGVLAGFATELLRRQPAGKVQQRYVAPPSSETAEAAREAPGASRSAPGDAASAAAAEQMPADGRRTR
jgi:hypothetical protein